ncbi:MAG: hypothetical protein ABEJ99_05690 [Candidatus Nanohaloarchaea archaeon]
MDVNVFYVDMQGGDALGLRGDLVRDLSGVHEDVREALSYGWDFEAFSGGAWYDFGVRYEGDRGRVTVFGRPGGSIEVVYRPDSAARMPDYVDDEVDFLNSSIDPDGVSEVERDAAGVRFTLEEDADLEDEEVSRYVRDVVGLYAGVDGDASYPSRGDANFRDGDRNCWWM